MFTDAEAMALAIKNAVLHIHLANLKKCCASFDNQEEIISSYQKAADTFWDRVYQRN